MAWTKISEDRWQRDDGSIVSIHHRDRWTAMIAAPGGGVRMMRTKGRPRAITSGNMARDGSLRSWPTAEKAMAALDAEKPEV